MIGPSQSSPMCPGGAAPRMCPRAPPPVLGSFLPGHTADAPPCGTGTCFCPRATPRRDPSATSAPAPPRQARQFPPPRLAPRTPPTRTPLLRCSHPQACLISSHGSPRTFQRPHARPCDAKTDRGRVFFFSSPDCQRPQLRARLLPSRPACPCGGQHPVQKNELSRLHTACMCLQQRRLKGYWFRGRGRGARGSSPRRARRAGKSAGRRRQGGAPERFAPRQAWAGCCAPGRLTPWPARPCRLPRRAQ
jgi:hypothetical protein